MGHSFIDRFRHGKAASPENSPHPAARSSDAGDALLIERIARRDLRAFEALFRAYHPRLGRFLSAMTPRRALVEECLNDTMLVVWNRADSYNHACKVSTWIFAVAYRTACKALARQDEPVEDLASAGMPSDERGPERQRSDRETREALRRALEGLSAEQRSVLVLTYFHDLPYAETARIMECPVDTIKTRMFHARRRMRALIAGELGDWL